jgi:hypothetical protein
MSIQGKHNRDNNSNIIKKREHNLYILLNLDRNISHDFFKDNKQKIIFMIFLPKVHLKKDIKGRDQMKGRKYIYRRGNMIAILLIQK